IPQTEYYRFRAFFEPHQVRLDRLPGQADLSKDGLPRAFDATPDAPTFLFVRGSEANPDKGQSLAPGVPEALGGSPLRIEAVPLPFAATHPDRRPFVIEETRQAVRDAAAAASAARAVARQNAARATLSVALGDPLGVAVRWAVEGKTFEALELAEAN